MGRCCEILSSSSVPVMLCLFMSATVHVGILKVIGLYLRDISIDLETSSADMGIALGLLNTFVYIPSPLIATLYRHRSIRSPLLISGAFLLTSGVALFSMATTNIQMSVCLSVTGLGISILLICCIVTLHHVARDNYNLCLGLGLSGYGAGMVLFPLLAEFLHSPYGWRGGLLIMSALIAHVIPCAVGITTGSDERSIRTRDFEQIESSSTGIIDQNMNREDTEAARSSGSRFGHVSVIHSIANSLRQSDFYVDPVFNVIFALNFAYYMVTTGWYSFLVPHVLQRGISVKNTIILTFAGAIGNTSSRLGVGVVTNHLLTPIDVYIFATILNITALLVDVFVANYYIMLVTTCFSAMAIGGRAVLTSLIVRERASSDKFDIAFSLIRCISGIGMFLGGYLGGLLADTFSSFNATFKMLTIVDGVVLILVLVMKCNPKPNSS
ncbi:monocarboxylate transporter 6-like isoform X2 [Lytechinus variegatus]|uniref:monocarboxylate transporter 6-like isoform X2 n=1 Tax=Lytechinus variegatus TaxID=7654 RepID=UPI001BB26180|nr:monocarboxylate transporter 6-like isoform X2 [Lytechinus variegatus]